MADIVPISDKNEIEKMADGILLDVRKESVPMDRTISVPISQLSALGAGVASLLPAFNTVTQALTFDTSGLLQVANPIMGDTLRKAKNGELYPSFLKSGKFATFKEVDSLKATSEIALKANPATLMMAAALFSIEKELGEIAEMEKQILSFLEIEKEAEIEADFITLTKIINNYKSSWDNEQFIASNHKMVCDIQRTARKNMISNKKRVDELVRNKGIILVHGQVNSKLKELLKMFKYYRLSLYSFSLASLLEIMLSENFKEEHINSAIEEVRKNSDEYRELFGECSVILERLGKGAIDVHVIKGIGVAENAVGKLFGSIPKKKEAEKENLLQDNGKKLIHNAEELKIDATKAFAEVSNPNTGGILNKMDDMLQIYGQTKEICFDKENIYFIA